MLPPSCFLLLCFFFFSLKGKCLMFYSSSVLNIKSRISLCCQTLYSGGGEYMDISTTWLFPCKYWFYICVHFWDLEQNKLAAHTPARLPRGPYLDLWSRHTLNLLIYLPTIRYNSSLCCLVFDIFALLFVLFFYLFKSLKSIKACNFLTRTHHSGILMESNLCLVL